MEKKAMDALATAAAKEREVNRLYRQAALLVHPDRHPDRAGLGAVFDRVVQARDELLAVARSATAKPVVQRAAPPSTPARAVPVASAEELLRKRTREVDEAAHARDRARKLAGDPMLRALLRRKAALEALQRASQPQ